ncbi:MAG: 30S ribosome-binding factor RbfA [Chloroflexota bacterium]|nr:30S ribosome-binding factor RbfA [Chloroflexota bacterium]
MGKKYQRRVSELVHVRLSNLLEREVKDPRLDMVTITDVVVTPDAARANVYFTVLGGEGALKDAQEGLESAAGWLRRELGRELRLRRTPELVFHYDRSVERGERIAAILDELGLGDEESDTEAS